MLNLKFFHSQFSFFVLEFQPILGAFLDSRISIHKSNDYRL